MKKISLIALVAVSFVLIFAIGAGAGPLDSAGAQKALVCSACHGFGGNAPGDTMPILAGMNADYFKKAIKDYADGKRPSPEMEPYSKYVLQSGVDEIANYFAGQKRGTAASGKPDAKAVSRGATSPHSAPLVTAPGETAMRRESCQRCVASPPVFCKRRWRWSAAINGNMTTPARKRPRKESSKASLKTILPI